MHNRKKIGLLLFKKKIVQYTYFTCEVLATLFVAQFCDETMPQFVFNIVLDFASRISKCLIMFKKLNEVSQEPGLCSACMVLKFKL